MTKDMQDAALVRPLMALARWACVIEARYGQPMDMEWAKDGGTGELELAA